MFGLESLSAASMAQPIKTEAGRAAAPTAPRAIDYVADCIQGIMLRVGHDSDTDPVSQGAVCPLSFVKPWNLDKLTVAQRNAIMDDFLLAGIMLSGLHSEFYITVTLVSNHSDTCPYIKRADFERNVANWIKHRSRRFKYSIRKACEESIYNGKPQDIAKMTADLQDQILIGYLNPELAKTPLNIGGFVHKPVLSFYKDLTDSDHYLPQHHVSLKFERL